MTTTHYRQCRLESESVGGYYWDMAWLPSDEVRIGRRVRFGDDPRVWAIVSAGTPREASVVESYAEHRRKRWGSLADA